MKKTPHSISYFEIAHIYLKIGSQAFGGWATTHNLLEKELIHKHSVLTAHQLKAAAASGQSLPGPAQIVLAAQTAYYFSGIRGAFLASGAYLLPSILITLLFSVLYFRFFASGNFTQYTLGLQAAIGGVILGAAYRIGKTHATSIKLWVIALLAAVTCFLVKIPAIFIILGFGIAGVLIAVIHKEKRRG